MRHRGWSVLLLLPAALLALTTWRAPFPSFHQHLALAGTEERFVAIVKRAGRADLRGALWLDNLFALSWLAIVPRLLVVGLRRWAPERRRMFGWWTHAPAVAVAAGVLELVENLVALKIAGRSSLWTPTVAGLAVFAWWKAIAFVAALVAVAALVVGPAIGPVVRPALRRLSARLDRPRPAVAGAGETIAGIDRRVGEGPRVGVCISDGRSAAVLGALRGLDSAEGGPSLFRRAAWLAAPAGGNDLPVAWRTGRDRADRGPDADRDGSFDPGGALDTSVRARSAGRAGDRTRPSVIRAALGAVAVLGGVLAFAHLVGAASGRLVRSAPLHPTFPFDDAGRQRALSVRDLLPLRLVAPGAALLLLAAALLGLAVLAGRPRPPEMTAPRRGRAPLRLRRAALVAGWGGAALLVALVGVPFAVRWGPSAFAALPFVGRADAGAGLVAGLIGAALVVVTVGALSSRSPRPWLHAGAVLLALELVLVAGKAAEVFARDGLSRWRTIRLPGLPAIPVVAVAAVWLLALDATAAHRRTPGGRMRRQRTTGAGDGTEWSSLRHGSGPELIVSASALCAGGTFAGAPALAFSFTGAQVAMRDRAEGDGSTVDAAAYPAGSWFDGYPESWTVEATAAMRGVAFGAPPIAGEPVGGAPALFAALGLRLGLWLPNPRFHHWFADPGVSPRVHLGYLAKELLGRYRPASDPFVYVNAGGRREAFGLTELLRRRPDVILCLDLTADQLDPGRELRTALALAVVELGVHTELDPPLGEGDGSGFVTSTGVVSYPQWLGGGTGRLIAGRLDGQVTVASASGGGLDHDRLVAAGEALGLRVRDVFAGVPA